MESMDKHQGESYKDSPVQQELRCRSERSHVEALLAMSDEVFLKQLQPFEAQSGSEEAVRGWDRASPMGCMLQSQQNKAHLESANFLSANGPIDINQTQLHADSHCADKEPTSSSQKSTSCSQTCHVPLNAAPNGLKSTFPSFEEKKESTRTSAQPHYYQTFARPVKPQKHTQRPNNTVVPIKNFTFLPPIKSPHCTSDQGCSSKKGSEEMLQHIFDRRNCAKGSRADANQELPVYHVNQTSRYTAGQQNFLFSAAVPKRFISSSRPEAVHFSLGKGVKSTNTAASARVNMHARCLFS